MTIMGQRRILRAGAGRINWLSSHSVVLLLHINPVAKLSWPEASVFMKIGNAIINIVYGQPCLHQNSVSNLRPDNEQFWQKLGIYLCSVHDTCRGGLGIFWESLKLSPLVTACDFTVGLLLPTEG